MKLIVYCCLSLAFLVSCNDEKEEKEPVVNRKTPGTQVLQLNGLIAQYPDSLSLRISLISYYRSNGEDSMAIVAADAGLKRDSAYADLWGEKAAIYMDIDDTLKAIDAYEHAIAFDAQPGYLKDLGYIYAFKNDPKALMMGDALVFADRAGTQNDGMLIKGIYFSNIGKKQEALKIFDVIITKSPGYALAYREKAIILYEAKQYAEAIKALERITTLQNSFADGYFWMAQCYEELNNREKAIENYKKVLLYEPNNGEVVDALERLGGN